MNSEVIIFLCFQTLYSAVVKQIGVKHVTIGEEKCEDNARICFKI